VHRASGNSLDSFSYDCTEQVLVGSPLHHEPAQRHFGIQENQLPFQNCSRVAPIIPKLTGEAGPMLRACYYNQTITSSQSLGKKAAGVGDQQPVIGSVKLDYVLLGLELIEKIRAGRQIGISGSNDGITK
jgi:hypothetical protein